MAAPAARVDALRALRAGVGGVAAADADRSSPSGLFGAAQLPLLAVPWHAKPKPAGEVPEYVGIILVSISTKPCCNSCLFNAARVGATGAAPCKGWLTSAGGLVLLHGCGWANCASVCVCVCCRAVWHLLW